MVISMARQQQQQSANSDYTLFPVLSAACPKIPSSDPLPEPFELASDIIQQHTNNNANVNEGGGV